MSKVFVILPKYSSYQYKTPEMQEHYKSVIVSNVEKMFDADKTVMMLAEDMFAVALFGNDERVTWITSFSGIDVDFMMNCVTDYPEVYPSIKAEQCSQSILEYLKKHLHVKTIRDCNGDTKEYTIARFYYLQEKIRLTVKELTKKYRNILQFSDGNNYCDPAVPVVGDGRFIMTIDLRTTACKVHYGGCAIESYQVGKLLEVL